MMWASSYLHDLTERADIARLRRIYKLYCGGLFKTCNYEQALILLKTGKWFDKTNYLPNEEVLPNEHQRQRDDSIQSKTSSEWQESRHQQYQSNAENYPGKESSMQGNGNGSPRSEIKKRGRPKVVK